ncbi:DUF1217 domain-containing protein [Azospirillum thermophilum]|uniref:Flagellar biosynthesis protein FlgG n=1 Tax=Azospirillum thermophilum TaxID=2202148 RepID=A0A2S2CUQ9_9PROT|nr:DUF1217 domain-containing protein [Azospirillum thermophilum]AWK88231.1 flagellar biosynthesis protein FlgG [Azospirillum thermophilum]
MTTLQDLRQVTRNQDRYDQMIRSRADVKRQIEYFTANIGKVTTVDEFMKDDKLYRFVMEAFDLGSQVNAKGLIRKVLNEGVTDPYALANRMSDSKFKEMAKILAFKETDGKTLKEPKIVQAIVDRFVKVKAEMKAEETNPAVRLALYFQRKAPTINNWYQVLADRALQKVVFTALDIPNQAALQDLDRLVTKIKTRFDIADLKDPKKLTKFIERFSAMYDVQNGFSSGTSSVSSTVVSMMSPVSRRGRASIISIDPSVTMSLLKFPRF